MNAPFTPVHNPYDDVSHLLAIMADPEGYRQRLQELIAQEKKTADRIAELNTMQAETLRLHQTAVATNIVADNRIKALDAREAELDERIQRLEQSESTRSEAAVRRRENAADAKENALVRREAAVAKREADADARFAKIKSFSSSL
jgi:hypothetical protein